MIYSRFQFQLKRRFADSNFVTGTQIAFRDSLIIHEGSPTTACVIESHSTTVSDDSAMHPRQRWVLELNVTRIPPSDQDCQIRWQNDGRFTQLVDCEQKHVRPRSECN